MKTVKAKANQTLFDVAVENYGNCEALHEIMQNNPEIGNEDAALAAAGIDPVGNADFYMDLALKKGSEIRIDTDSRWLKNSVVREIETDVTTYNE